MRSIRLLWFLLFAVQIVFSQKVPWEFDGLYDPVSYKKEVIKLASEAIGVNEKKLEIWSSKSITNWNLIKEYGDQKLRVIDDKPSWGSRALPILVGGTGVVMYSVHSENYVPVLLTVLALEVYGLVELISAISQTDDNATEAEKTLSNSYYNLKRAYFYNDYQAINDKVLKNVLKKNRIRIEKTEDQKPLEQFSIKGNLEKAVINSNFDTNEEFENCVPRHPTFPSIRKRNAIKMRDFLKAPEEELPLIDNWRRESEAFEITQIMANHTSPVLLNTDYENYKTNAIWKTVAGAAIGSLGVLWFNSSLNDDNYSSEYEREEAQSTQTFWSGFTTFIGFSYAFKHSFRIGSYEKLHRRQMNYKKALQTSYHNYKDDRLEKKPSPTCKNTLLKARDISQDYFFLDDSSWAGFNSYYMKKPVHKTNFWGGQYNNYLIQDTVRVSNSVMDQQYHIKAYYAREVSPRNHYPALWLLYYIPGYVDYMLLQDHQDEHWQEAKTTHDSYKINNEIPGEIIDATHILDWESIQ